MYVVEGVFLGTFDVMFRHVLLSQGIVTALTTASQALSCSTEPEAKITLKVVFGALVSCFSTFPAHKWITQALRARLLPAVVNQYNTGSLLATKACNNIEVNSPPVGRTTKSATNTNSNAVPVALPTIVQNHARKTIGGTVIIDTFICITDHAVGDSHLSTRDLSFMRALVLHDHLAAKENTSMMMIQSMQADATDFTYTRFDYFSGRFRPKEDNGMLTTHPIRHALGFPRTRRNNHRYQRRKYSVPGRKLDDEFFDLERDIAAAELGGSPPGKLRLQFEDWLSKGHIWGVGVQDLNGLEDEVLIKCILWPWCRNVFQAFPYSPRSTGGCESYTTFIK
ncbi:hypothetical protein B0H13DRAFT_1928019 [Mycena leptocephala]|nr:hypothetical protein B0H13DRAFT_1928019 [Mycena leptocephala]